MNETEDYLSAVERLNDAQSYLAYQRGVALGNIRYFRNDFPQSQIVNVAIEGMEAVIRIIDETQLILIQGADDV